MIFRIVFLVFALTQLYWFWRGWIWARRIARPSLRAALIAAVLALYLVLLGYNLGWFGRRSFTPVRLTLQDMFLAAPFLCWMAASIVGFLMAAIFWLVRGLAAAGKWAYHRASRRPPLASPARRQFLERTAAACTAAPFVAGSYGFFYGRLNLEVKHQRIGLKRLPAAFDGFRIAQLSDIHIGPFMTAEQIRKYVAIANALKPDLIVLTGDFVTWDPGTQQAVVEALSGLRAPLGIYGCLGNHDAWAGVEASITELFRRSGTRILRQERAEIRAGGESFHLIGVDFQSPHRFGPSPPVTHLLANIEGLLDRHNVNILLSHNPDTFNRAAQLGVDLSLAGHTHGGQASLEFISPEIAPSRLVTPYVAGWFQRPGGQLYVNRGIGTIFVPIRIGAPPEITVFELKRAAV
jgi:predicted MPP superfamily phosphohydrolase